eukprot:9501433-Pyramimonas_sp.AAC.1
MSVQPFLPPGPSLVATAGFSVKFWSEGTPAEWRRRRKLWQVANAPASAHSWPSSRSVFVRRPRSTPSCLRQVPS